MRIPLIYIPKTRYKKFLHIEKRYNSDKLIIPLGCDCHPAFMLDSLHLRTTSLPFDWLNIDPIRTFEYVTENINDSFENFLKKPTKIRRSAGKPSCPIRRAGRGMCAVVETHVCCGTRTWQAGPGSPRVEDRNRLAPGHPIY